MSKDYVVIDGKTINLSIETVRNLKEQLGIKEEHKFGDIVEHRYGKRVILYDEDGELIAVNETGHRVGAAGDTDYYKLTGKNIFEDNLLGLNN